MTVTILVSDLATIAQEIEMWPYTRAPRLFDLDYAAAVSAAIVGMEGNLYNWHELAAWTSDVAIAHWLLAQEHPNAAYVATIMARLDEMQFRPGGGLEGTIKRGEMPDAEDFEGALGALEVLRHLQADR